MRFSVECAFPHLGKRRVTSRKGTVCITASRKGAVCVIAYTQSASFGAVARAIVGTLESSGNAGVYTDRRKWPIGDVLGVCVHCCAASGYRVRFFSPGQTRRRLTERRTLRHHLTEGAFCNSPHGRSIHSTISSYPSCVSRDRFWRPAPLSISVS